MKGNVIFYDLGKQEGNDVIYTIDEWKQLISAYDELEEENERLQEWIDLFDTHRLEGMFSHYMEMQKQAVHGQSGESTVKFWHERAKSQREIIEAHIALTKD